MKVRYSLAAGAVLLATIAGVWWLRLGIHAEAESPAVTRIEAFTAESYGNYLNAMARFQQGEVVTPPHPLAFFHIFTLVREAERAERNPHELESWWGSVAVYALDSDPAPSGWIIRTTLSGDLEGIRVLSNTNTPL